MNRRISCLVTLLLPGTLWAQGASLDALAELEAQEPEIRRYRAEVIIFAYAEDAYTGTEIFVPEVIEPIEPPFDGELEGPLADDSMAVQTRTEPQPLDSFGNPVQYDKNGDPIKLDENGQPVEDRFHYELLAEEDLELSDTAAMLDRLDAYQPLMHFGWVQTTIPAEETPELELLKFGRVPKDLDGTLKLYLSRYLHLVVDVSLAAPAEEQAEGERFDGFAPHEDDFEDSFSRGRFSRDRYESGPMYAPLRYAIIENRILKNGETRYYDHPKFGVIARVARVEEGEEEESPSDDSASGVVGVE